MSTLDDNLKTAQIEQMHATVEQIRLAVDRQVLENRKLIEDMQKARTERMTARLHARKTLLDIRYAPFYFALAVTTGMVGIGTLLGRFVFH